MLSGKSGQRRSPLSQSALGVLGLLLLSSSFACGDDDDASGVELGGDGDSGDGDGGEGQKIELKEGEWVWTDFADAFCRDGTNATIAIKQRAASKNLMIFLEGGGACYDSLTCAANPASAIREFLSRDGLLNESEPRNPVKDWNVVYVPYCTGDSHAGTNPEGVVDGVAGPQKFMGYSNMTVFLKAIVPLFPDLEKVLLTGISAGGFGASANTVQVMNAFPSTVKGMLIDDSGPAMSSKYLAPCLQEKWRNLWGLDNSMLKDCGADCPNPNDFVLDFSKHLAKTYGDRKSGIIEATEDLVIRGFFGVGQDNCTNRFLLDPPLPGPLFTEGLLDFREQMKEYPNFFTYYPSGSVSNQHTWLSSPSLYTYSVGGVALIDWVTAIINDMPTTNAGP